MIDFIFRRALHGFVAMAALIVAVFMLSRLTGDPAMLYLPETAQAEDIQLFREMHGLDKPIVQQFFDYLVQLVHFDFGTSLRRGTPAMEEVLRAFPWTLRLAALTVVFSLIVALVVGPLAAHKSGSFFDRVASTLSLAAASIPDFWLAIMGILVFAVELRVLPTSGTGGPVYWVMPVAVLMFRMTGTVTQVVRGSMLATLSSPYIKAARGKGMPERRVVYVHALRNSVISAVTVAGDQMRGLINGAVVVETVFGWPGVGKLMIDAIMTRDFAVVQAAVVMTALAIFILNIVLDLLHAVLDPRVRLN